MVPRLQAMQLRLGWSFQRLIPALGLTRSSVFRWAGRLRRGEPAVRQPGPPKLALPDPQLLNTAIAELHHGRRRSAGAPALWRTWQAMISRRDFNARVRQCRRAQQPQLCRIHWLQSAVVWAMDPAQHSDRLWNLVSDLGSRFRFELLVATALPAQRIAEHLELLFDRYGAPLVLKRDNGSNLVNGTVDQLLDAYGVIPLTSPTYYPQYNGAIEYAQRELKGSVHDLTAAGASEDEALTMAPAWLNVQQRPCLGGRTAHTAFYQARTLFQRAYSLDCRKEIKDSIAHRTQTIVGSMQTVSRRVYDAAWRQAVEEWLLDLHIIEVVQPKPVLPYF